MNVIKPLMALRAFLDRPTPHRRSFVTDLGQLGLFLFAIEVVTGALMTLYYRPDPEAAFASVRLMSHAVTFGWLVRSIHLMTAHALVVIAVLVLARMYFRRSFLEADGARSWWVAVGLVVVTLGFFLTGDALPWDQDAFWRTVVTTEMVERAPLVGSGMASILRGGDDVTGFTLVRLYAAHAFLLPWVAAALLYAAWRLRRRGGVR